MNSGHRVLIVGATGMLGSMLFRRLSLRPGWQVRATQRSRPAEPDFLDARDPAADLSAVINASPRTDYVINAAGLIQTEIEAAGDDAASLAEAINHRLPRRLANAATAAGARLIHISTDGVFSGKAGPYDESAEPDPGDLYGRTKLAGEVVSPAVLTLRCSIVGPDPTRRRGLYEWFRGLAPGAVVRGFVDQLWNGMTTVQLAGLCEAVIESGGFDRLTAIAPVRHCCPNPLLSKYELLLFLKDALGSSARVESAESGNPLNRVLRSRWSDLSDLVPAPYNWRHLAAELVDADPRGRLDASAHS